MKLTYLNEETGQTIEIGNANNDLDIHEMADEIRNLLFAIGYEAVSINKILKKKKDDIFSSL